MRQNHKLILGAAIAVLTLVGIYQLSAGLANVDNVGTEAEAGTGSYERGTDTAASGDRFAMFKQRNNPVTKYAHPDDFRVICGAFDPNENLVSQKARSAHADWWTQHRDEGQNYQDPPSAYYGRGLANDSNYNGSYAFARPGGNYTATIAQAVRATGDRDILDELYRWAEKWRTEALGDWDGRGYEYIEYQKVRNSSDGPIRDSLHGDTVFLDEEMMAGYIGLIAEVFHDNRECDQKYADAADFWFTYLDENWVPKWLHRSTTRHPQPYIPPAELGLQNAVGWDGMINRANGDGEVWRADPRNLQWPGDDGKKNGWNDADLKARFPHEFPSRHYGHPYIMTMYMYKVLGDYFTEMGKDPKGTRNQSASDYVNEAQVRHDFWFERYSELQSDGRRTWFMRPGNQDRMRSYSYSQHVATFTILLHHQGLGDFADDEVMRGYANTWYNGTGKRAIYKTGNTNTISLWNDGGSGTYGFLAFSSAAIGCWDETGEINRLNAAAIISPLRHKMANATGTGTSWHHGSHYSNIMSCEQKQAFDANSSDFL